MSDLTRSASQSALSVAEAAERLRGGDLVGFPTETVYGLAADATSCDAVAKIFALKGRPATNPLIVHVSDIATARRYAADWPAAAETLANAFWPGPLTIVLPKANSIPSIVTAGGATVGLRVPAHPVALELLKAFDGPLAAPSANRSNHVSPTTAAHVREEFGAAVAVLDGGPCSVGIESTVVDLSGKGWRVLRPGGITAEAIAKVLNSTMDVAAAGATDILRSPGQLEVHYAPRTPAFRFEAHERLGIDLVDAVVLEPTLDPSTYARNLYARLRMLDTQGLRAIYIELPPDTAAWRAIRDRLMRATRPMPK
ncbi:MAG: threonylcarbamoyl-AMP synthase [Phycisphaerales bacterium]|nr:threonylcarbamoyl-AMP synthase [Phycisphaerales bacterium]